MDIYFKDSRGSSAHPLKFWSVNTRFQHLRVAARHLYGLAYSSIVVERLFSAPGQTYGVRRDSLHHTTLITQVSASVWLAEGTSPMSFSQTKIAKKAAAIQVGKRKGNRKGSKRDFGNLAQSPIELWTCSFNQSGFHSVFVFKLFLNKITVSAYIGEWTCESQSALTLESPLLSDFLSFNSTSNLGFSHHTVFTEWFC